MRDIVTRSSNIGTIMMAQMLGKDRIDEYLRRFGLGTSTALDFPGESAGLMLDPKDWSGTSIGSIPIGQGISVTALQMLEVYNVIANGGIVRRSSPRRRDHRRRMALGTTPPRRSSAVSSRPRRRRR